MSTNSASTLGGGMFCPYSSKYGLILLKFFIKIVFQQKNTLFEKTLKKTNFYGNGTESNLLFCSNLEPTFSSQDDQNRKKQIS